MKKFFLICLCLMFTSALAWESFMDKCIKSWIGYPIESVIEKWGYPNKERETSEKKLLVWEKYDMHYNENLNSYYADVMLGGNNFPSANVLDIDYCRVTLEINSEKVVVGGKWDGNDCPKFYRFGKDYVNPKNNKWEK